MRRIDRSSPEYPSAFTALATAPAEIWVRGAIPDAPLVAVVGSRAPDRAGRRFAHDLGARLADSGVGVVSGGALGIDGEAHRGALEAGGQTVAVLGTGVDVPYPREHGPLFERISKSGALVSEFPLGTLARRQHFPARNRLVAALGAAVVVVQAGAKSGALSTASQARKLGRPVIAIPWGPYDPRGEGIAILARSGALLAWSVAEAMSLAGVCSPARALARTRNDDSARSKSARTVLRALDEGPLYIAEIVDETALLPEVVSAEILTLTLEGLVEEVDFQRFGLVRRT